MSLEQRRIWVEGELRPWAEAQVHLMSQSLQRGTLVFDVMQVFQTAQGPAILGFREHVARLQNSARLNGMELRHDLDGLMRAVAAAVHANPGADIAKICAYYPGVSLDILPAEEFATVAVAVLSIAEVSGPRDPRSAARLQIAASRKMPSNVLSPQVKIAASYTHAAIAKQLARKAGFHDVLFLDAAGNLAESSTQSFFIVVDGKVLTPTLDTVLAGVTRSAVIELARDEGLELVEQTLSAELLVRCDEAFLTGTTIGIWPVERIDSRALPAPLPGPVTQRLIARFEKMTSGGDATFSPRWLQPVPVP